MATSTEGPTAPDRPVDLIVFGGAFDPPHSGHVGMLADARRRFPAATALVLPGMAPAVARGDAKPAPAASFTDRLAMCRLAFGDAAVSDLEASLPAPNYTINTLRKVAELYPDRRLGLLIGADQQEQFSRWREPEAIRALAEVIVAPRPVGAAASRQIREALKDGREPPAGWLPGPVKSYIRDRRLYVAS